MYDNCVRKMKMTEKKNQFRLFALYICWKIEKDRETAEPYKCFVFDGSDTDGMEAG